MDEGGRVWHPESILIPMQIAIDENILTQGLLFLNQILIEILVLRSWVFSKNGSLTLDSFLCWGFILWWKWWAFVATGGNTNKNCQKNYPFKRSFIHYAS
jgi:hypothetical protein